MLINISNEERLKTFNTVVKKSAVVLCALTTGGKISKLEHIEKLLKSGSDKVLITSR